MAPGSYECRQEPKAPDHEGQFHPLGEALEVEVEPALVEAFVDPSAAVLGRRNDILNSRQGRRRSYPVISFLLARTAVARVEAAGDGNLLPHGWAEAGA